MKKILLSLALIAIVASTTGCFRPYATPVIEEIPNNFTAFLIPLDGNTEDQAKFASVEALNQQKVATKRVTIPVRWQKMRRGFGPLSGNHLPTARLLLVNRTPIARRWTAEVNTGTSAISQSLGAESKDSVGVNSGFAITAYVTEEDAATYLYWYPGKDLAEIVDNQIFNACQAIYAQVCAEWDVRDLRLHKEDVSNAIRDQLIPQFKKQGITIDPALGLIGGLVYDNPEIQQAIDHVFIAQTLEAKREAERTAQVKQNELELSIEENEANKRKVKADAEAYEITAKVKAISAGGKSYLEIRALEVDALRVQKWNGAYPQVMSGGAGGLSAPVVVPIPIKNEG